MSKQRTKQQNRSLHKYCELLAKELNDAGIDQRMLFEQLKEGFEIPNTKESIKHLFRLVGGKLYPESQGDDPSTTKLDTAQISEVYKVFDREMALRNEGISVPWPTDEPPMIRDLP